MVLKDSILLGTLCLLSLMARHSTVQGNSGSGSGSGSGGLPEMPPILTACPASNVNQMLIRPVSSDSATQINISGMNLPMASHPNNSAFTVSISANPQLTPADRNSLLTSGSVTVLSTAPQSGDYLLITVTGDLSSVDTIVVYVSVVATTTSCMAASLPCNFTIDITVQNPMNCSSMGSSNSILETTPISTALQSVASVMMTLDIPFANYSYMAMMRMMQVQMVVANEMNRQCSQNCGRCRMEATCTAFLRDCSEFSSNNVIFTQPARPAMVLPGGRIAKRVVSSSNDATVITFFVMIPSGAPLNGLLPFVPASTTLDVVIQSISVFENITGIQVVGTPEILITSPGIIFTTFFAQIVAPILVVLAITVLAIGIVIILVVVYVKKAKKRSKVQPTGTAHTANSSSVGKDQL